jgi:chemotaxis protein MotB
VEGLKTAQSVEPRTFTLSSSELFNSGSAALISKEKAKEAFGEALNHMRQNPTDKMRVEVHTDNTRLKLQKTKKGKLVGFKNNFALSAARAKTLASLLKESGVAQKKLIAVGMGEKLPKAPNKTKEGRELNNRVEIVVCPSDVKVIHSGNLPVLKDREEVVVSVAYSRGPRSKNCVSGAAPERHAVFKGGF